MSNTRQMIKQKMARVRGGWRCDLCGGVGTEMHEIIPRAQTMHNEAAREASYDERICALLCHRCHQQVQGHEEELLALAVKRYGANAVQEALNRVYHLLGIPALLSVKGGD